MTNDKALIKRQVRRILRNGTRDVAGSDFSALPPAIGYAETEVMKSLTVPQLHQLAVLLEYMVEKFGSEATKLKLNKR
jgi:hypothetical protein